MSVIDEHLKKIEPTKRAELERVRQIIQKTAPDAEEAISYGMSAFKYKKKYLIAFEAFKDHMSIFPGSSAIEQHQEQLKNYTVSKGTVQFTAKNPLSEKIIQGLVLARMKAIDKK